MALAVTVAELLPESVALAAAFAFSSTLALAPTLALAERVAFADATGVLHGSLAHLLSSHPLVATFTNGIGVEDDEQGAAIYICRGQVKPWAATWTAFRDYN